MLRNALFTLVITACMLPFAISADTLLIEDVSAAQETAGERPARGISMDEVTERWGQPVKKGAPVGDPPIARWEYPSFVVYFEYQTVLHSVVSRN